MALPERVEGVEEEIHDDAREEKRRESHERDVDRARPAPAEAVIRQKRKGEDAPDREGEPDLGIGERARARPLDPSHAENDREREEQEPAAGGPDVHLAQRLERRHAPEEVREAGRLCGPAPRRGGPRAPAGPRSFPRGRRYERTPRKRARKALATKLLEVGRAGA